MTTLAWGMIVSVALASCAAGGRLPPEASYYFERYKTKSHYRAMATTGMSVRGGWASGTSEGRGSVEGAIAEAMIFCEQGRKKHGLDSKCKLYAIGDIVVSGLSPEELEAATTTYKNDVTAGSRSSGYTSASDSVICNFAITTKDGTVSWESRANWLGYVNEAKRRSLTPEQCAELSGR